MLSIVLIYYNQSINQSTDRRGIKMAGTIDWTVELNDFSAAKQFVGAGDALFQTDQSELLVLHCCVYHGNR
jgi:hypothetical protein